MYANRVMHHAMSMSVALHESRHRYGNGPPSMLAALFRPSYATDSLSFSTLTSRAIFPYTSRLSFQPQRSNMKFLIVALQVLLVGFVSAQSIESSTAAINTGDASSSASASSGSAATASLTSTFNTELGHQSTTSSVAFLTSTATGLGHQTATSSAVTSVNAASSTAGDGHQSASNTSGSGASVTPTGSSDGSRAFKGNGVAVMRAAAGAAGAVMVLM